jgi:UDP-glucose 4-epimerase
MTQQKKTPPPGRPPARRAQRRKVLITGIGRQLGKILAKRLDPTCEVIGMGRKDWVGGKPSGIRADAVALDRSKAEDCFRRQAIDTVIHLEYVHSPKLPAEERYRINVGGTMRLLDFCRKYDVRKVIVLSTAHVYGALPDNHPYIEEEDPIRAEQDYAALRHVIEADTYVRSWMYRHKDIRTVILRPCNIVGPTIRNSMTRYLRRRYCPTLLGFNPMMQFIHEEDMSEAVALAVEKRQAAGIFNIAGSGFTPISDAIREAGGMPVPFLHPLIYTSIKILWPLGLTTFPSPEIDYLKYACIVSTKRAEKILGFQPRYSLLETIGSLRSAAR